MTVVHKPEIENLAARFRAELISVSLKYRGSKAVGAVGGFVADVEAHRAGYVKKFATIRVGADAATIVLADETERKIDALAQQEIQRVRNARRVELNPELPPYQHPPQSHATVDPITNKRNRKKRLPTAGRGAPNVAPVGLEIMAKESGPEKYAPPDRHAQQRDIERIMQWNQADPANDPAAENLNAAVQRVPSVSSDEIDQVIISTLEGARDMMLIRRVEENGLAATLPCSTPAEAFAEARKIVDNKVEGPRK
jgi:hypothetical protein